jgi:hypothetical protein
MAYAYPNLPPLIREGLERYLLEHIPTGGFLEAAIANDFADAMFRADTAMGDFTMLRDLAWFIHNHMPAITSGSRQAFSEWTTCHCHLAGQRLIEVPPCLVHTWPAERVRALMMEES